MKRSVLKLSSCSGRKLFLLFIEFFYIHHKTNPVFYSKNGGRGNV
ncbi:hypothetical protein CLOSTASPAR_03874 [[Clostridium] asparagiforme DSM 15981]|uniref:Uncharacterized protein n=1 Tax=[Clostridium] asparagiforme DSM 15981 TaxID=518636 RepID=C0D3N3_9FIRM|nr:hypothetical protein CLOSTASPAR_03874 [[Clostridium] asparagiforme DSM 15981]